MNFLDTAQLVGDFCSLARIEGISLKERKVADYIKSKLEPLRVRVVEQPISFGGAESGNLICIPEETDRDKPVTFLAAHMDTVQSTQLLTPIVNDTAITSDGSTILGADNRAGVAALLYMIEVARKQKLPLNNVGVIFTVAEEIGLVGARHLDFSGYPTVKQIFVFDCSRRPGVFIQHCYGCLKFRMEVTGKSAHAGVAPEAGINAIAIAADIIHDVEQGRLDDDATFNIGTIHGGDATNVVSSRVVFEGEIRGPSMGVIEKHIHKLEKIAAAVTDRFKGSYRLDTSLAFAPFHIDPSSDHFKAAEKMIRKAGLEPKPIQYTGGSDANAFNSNGIPAVNFGIGAQQPHSHDEFIYIEDLRKTAELALIAATEHIG
jgi:tripeptide aminopeptidase